MYRSPPRASLFCYESAKHHSGYLASLSCSIAFGWQPTQKRVRCDAASLFVQSYIRWLRRCVVACYNSYWLEVQTRARWVYTLTRCFPQLGIHRVGVECRVLQLCSLSGAAFQGRFPCPNSRISAVHVSCTGTWWHPLRAVVASSLPQLSMHGAITCAAIYSQHRLKRWTDTTTC
jgi:hypothetical protein